MAVGWQKGRKRRPRGAECSNREWAWARIRREVPRSWPISVQKHPDREVLEVVIGREPESTYGILSFREIDRLREGEGDDDWHTAYFAEFVKPFIYQESAR